MEKEQYKGKIVRVTTERKKVGKKTIEFERVYLPSSVHIFVITNDDKIRLVREKRWDRGGKIRDKIPAGIIEKKESPLQSAKRELEEELGIKARQWKKFFVVEQKGVVNDKRIYYIARNIHRVETHPEDGEEIFGFIDYSVTQLYQKMLDGYFGTSPTAVMIATLYRQFKKGEIKL